MLHNQVVEDWKNALKTKDAKKDVLSLIIAELKNRAIKDNMPTDAGRMVTDEVAREVLQKMAKQRRESIESYQAAKREDLALKESFELSIIEGYLPKSLNDDELRSVIRKVLEEQGISSKKDLGRAMGVAIKAVAGRADGKRIQNTVSSLLDG